MIMEGILFLSFQVSVQIRSTHISSFCYVSVLIFGKKPEKHISSNCNNIKRKKKTGDICIFQEYITHSTSTVGKK